MTHHPRTAVLSSLLAEEQARRLLSRNLRFVPGAELLDPPPGAPAFWLGPMPGEDDYFKRKSRCKAPPAAQPRLADHYLWPLLSPEQERHLFRKFNYTKLLACDLRHKVELGELDRVEEAMALQAASDVLRVWLWSANQRLVVKIAYKFTPKLGKDFLEVVADGDVSLLGAVENFDYSYGFKFSTYAYWALVKNYSRELAVHRRAAARQPERIDDDGGPDSSSLGADDGDTSALLVVLLAYLEPRERAVLRLRAGLGDEEAMTLKEVGLRLGVTKERARQVESAARFKLARIAKNVFAENPF